MRIRAGDSAFGVSQLLGNGWEWTSTVFGPFPGFKPMPTYPGYSANFFDGQHYVIKGGSPRTAAAITASIVSELVPARLSVYVRDIPLR